MAERFGHRLTGLIRVLLVIGIAYTIATAVLSFLAGGSLGRNGAGNLPGPSPGGSQDPLNSDPSTNRFDLAAVSRRQLFGAAVSPLEPEATMSTQADLPDTRLPLELHGVFVDEFREQSAAIIAEKNKAGRLYAVGAEVPGNVTLSEVYPQFVLLRRGPSVERLAFVDRLSGVTSDADPGINEPAVAASSDLDSRRGPRQARAFLEAQREQFEADPVGTLGGFGIAPVVAGEAEGYRLGSLAAAPYLSQTGLKSGDIVVSVDGQPLGQADYDRQQLAALLEQGVAKLEVRRGTRRFFVTVSLR